MKSHMYSFFGILIFGALILAACSPGQNPPPTLGLSDADQSSADQAAEEPATEAEPNSGAEDRADEPAVREEPDLSAIPIGTDKFSNGPQVGYLWSCQTNFDDSGGAQATGEWYDEASGVWNFNLKPLVDGSVDWDSQVSITVQGDTRIIEANGLPSHPTGNYPIASSDDAYQYDSNPNSISAQSYRLELPANPTVNAEPECTRGEVGISVDGVVINNALDALGRDAVATELQDACEGHPHEGGVYHYHGYSICLEDQDALGHSALIGYALDGFGIFGPYHTDGSVLTSQDLDECHGHTHEVEWDGETVEMFHHHTTFDYPYTVGCFRGSAVVFSDAMSGNSGSDAEQNSNQDGPPDTAINACSGLSQGDACSFNTPNGDVSGTCADVQGELACRPE